MSEIRQVKLEDSEKVFSLLSFFNNKELTQQKIEFLITGPWVANSKEYPSGYVLLDDDKVVGFIGMLFSKRTINSGNFVFCNLWAWIVAEPYRSLQNSFKLLQPILEDTETIYTNLSPSATASTIFKKVGFTYLDSSMEVLYPRLLPVWKNDDLKIETNKTEIPGILPEAEMELFTDHRYFDCDHVVVSINKKNCYLIIKKVKIGFFTMAHFCYLSNPAVLEKVLKNNLNQLIKRMRCSGILIDERMSKRLELPLHLHLKLIAPRLYKGSTVLPKNIDSAYSELMALSIPPAFKNISFLITIMNQIYWLINGVRKKLRMENMKKAG